MEKGQPPEIVLTGVAGSSGICIGKAYLVDKEGVDLVEKYAIERKHVSSEVRRFQNAVKAARDELLSIIDSAPEDLRRYTSILETHITMLQDKALYDRTIETIQKENVNAEWAFKKSVIEVKAMFQDITDAYLRQRAEDVVHVSDNVMRNLTGAKSFKIRDIEKRVILVAKDLSPAETSQIKMDRIKGFVTDRGGKSSHTSIIARALEIPAVLALANATRVIQNDDLIIVDGTAGIVIIHPSEQTLEEYKARNEAYRRYRNFIKKAGKLEAKTTDGIRIPVMGNIELHGEAEGVKIYGGDGIGLYRTEFQYLSRSDFPTEQELYENYKEVVSTMGSLPVTIRTLDINGDKAIAYNGNMAETNPALGLRAIRYCLKNPDVFSVQLRAILRASAHGQVRILFPMISCLDEVIEAKKLLKQAELSLEKHKIPYDPNMRIGAMIEVPAAVAIADILADHLDFFSIGTNDLIQYSLAIDRGNRDVAHLYNPLHPAILRMIKHTADVAIDKGIGIYMCGEMAGESLCAPILLGMGVGELSMNPTAIPIVKSAIRSLDFGQTADFIREVMQKDHAGAVAALIEDRYGDLIEDKACFK